MTLDRPKKSITRGFGAVIAAVFYLITAPSFAGPIAFDASSGSIRYTFNTSGVPRERYFKAETLAPLVLSVRPLGFGFLQVSQELGYLVFDLSALSFPAQGASLELEVGGCPGPAGTTLPCPYVVNILNISPIQGNQLAALPPGELLSVADTALAASFVRSPAMDTLSLTTFPSLNTIALGTTALQQINAGGGSFAIGLELRPTREAEFQFDSSLQLGPARLIVSSGQAAIPTVSSAWLILLGLSMLSLRRREFLKSINGDRFID